MKGEKIEEIRQGRIMIKNSKEKKRKEKIEDRRICMLIVSRRGWWGQQGADENYYQVSTDSVGLIAVT